MAQTQEKLAFAERLKQALKRSPKKIETPSELALQFNLRHEGGQITNQAAQKWLAGENRPSADKIETLARMLNVSAQWLRYGIPEVVSHRSQESLALACSEQELQQEEAQLIQRYRLLSDYQKTLINGMVEQLALDRQMWVTTES